MTLLVANNAASLLETAIDAVASTIEVDAIDADKFPSPTSPDYFYVTVENGDTFELEIMRCTERLGTILAVERAADGTTATAFPAGSFVEMRVNAAVLTDFVTDLTADAAAAAASAAAALTSANAAAVDAAAAAISAAEAATSAENLELIAVTATGSDTPRAVADRFAEDINVLDYGAVFDGVTDDSVAIQAAIDASIDGDTILFPQGIGVCENVVFKGRRRYLGFASPDGQQGTVLLLAPSSTGSIFVADRWNENDVTLGRPVVIDGIAFDGNSSNAPSGQHGIILCNYRPFVSRCVFRNLVEDAIHMPDTYKDGTPFVQNAVNARIIDCWFDDTVLGYGVYAGPQTGETTYTDGWLLDCIDQSVKSVTIYPSSGWLIQGNHMSANTNGMYFFSGKAFRFIDNYLEGITTAEPLVTIDSIDEKGCIIARNQGKVGSATAIFSVKGGSVGQCECHITDNIFRDAQVPIGIEAALTTGTGNTLELYLSSNALDYTERFVRKNGANGADQNIYDNGNNSWSYLSAAPASVTNGFIYEGTFFRNNDFSGSAEQSIFGWVNTSQGNPGENRAVPMVRKLLRGGTTWDPGSIAAGGTETRSFTVTGAAIDDMIFVFPPVNLQGLIHSAYCDAADSVTIVLYNPTVGAIDLASDFWNVNVIRF